MSICQEMDYVHKPKWTKLFEQDDPCLPESRNVCVDDCGQVDQIIDDVHTLQLPDKDQ